MLSTDNLAAKSRTAMLAVDAALNRTQLQIHSAEIDGPAPTQTAGPERHSYFN